jgi:hypothetical protein
MSLLSGCCERTPLELVKPYCHQSPRSLRIIEVHLRSAGNTYADWYPAKIAMSEVHLPVYQCTVTEMLSGIDDMAVELHDLKQIHEH